MEQGEEYRPWYMSGGTPWPLPAAKSRKSGRRMAVLWPDEGPGPDRVTNQLMFVPPSPSAGETSDQKLKKILFYYGLGRWIPLKPGRDMFREARCRVDTCTITLDQNQTADADAIVYEDHFAHPGHPRPPRQVRGVHLLYSRSSTESRDRVALSTLSSGDPGSNSVWRLRLFVIPLRPFRKTQRGRTFKMLRVYPSILLPIHHSRNNI
jgi:hypothetical protein